MYRRADVFVTASSHEGFCVPLIEAMASSTPIVATPVGAVPETVGSGGLLLEEVSPEAIAEALDLATSSAVSSELVLAGRQRARELSVEASEERLVAFLEAHL